jgi:prevent-host-death family protein
VGPACACENGKEKSLAAGNDLGRGCAIRRKTISESTAPGQTCGPRRHRAVSDQLDGQEMVLRNVNLADAKAHLSKLVEWAAAGDTVRITRRGKPVAQITAVQTPRKRIDLSALRALTDMMPVQRESARDLVRRLRDQDRY